MRQRKTAAHIAILLAAALGAAQLAAQEGASPSQAGGTRTYRIESVSYDIHGLTKESAVHRIISADTARTFSGQDELDAYVQALTETLENTRQFETVQSSLDYLEEQDGITPVRVTYTLKDSFHFLALPWLTYNSNSGLSVKIKVKDSNFLGLMEPLNADLNYLLDTSSRHHLGFNLGYTYPFRTGPLQNSFSNSLSFDWIIGEELPEFGYSTGLSTSIPVGKQKLNISFTQSLTREADYVPYNDSFYLSESASVSMPISLGRIGGTVPVSYTPSVSFSYNWDPTDGQILYSGLKGPSLGISQSLSASRVKWQGNFRDGFSFSAGSGATWNFYSESISASASMSVQMYKAWKYAGLASRAYFYTAYNTTMSVTERLRGVRDSHAQRYTSQAIVLNFDVPVHILTTDWVNWGLRLFGPYEERNGFLKVITWVPNRLFPYLDFELQLSPFVDMAFTNNTATGRCMYWKDGFYTAGIEVLVHPARWKSYVVRGSFGVDIGRKVLGRLLDTSWRSTVSSWELFIGIGFEY